MCLVAKLCLTLCDLMDGSPPDSSVHGISQARILEWVAISFSRGSSQPRDQTYISCIGRWILYHQARPTLCQMLGPVFRAAINKKHMVLVGNRDFEQGNSSGMYIMKEVQQSFLLFITIIEK